MLTDLEPPILQYFEYEHLPPYLQQISKPFYDLAKSIMITVPYNAEMFMCLRKLLEAKDCAVRASVTVSYVDQKQEL